MLGVHTQKYKSSSHHSFPAHHERANFELTGLEQSRSLERFVLPLPKIHHEEGGGDADDRGIDFVFQRKSSKSLAWGTDSNAKGDVKKREGERKWSCGDADTTFGWVEVRALMGHSGDSIQPETERLSQEGRPRKSRGKTSTWSSGDKHSMQQSRKMREFGVIWGGGEENHP